MLTQVWETTINRADELAATGEATSELLTFYGGVLRTQKRIYDALRNRNDWLPSGKLRDDAPVLCDLLPDFLKTIETIGTPQLIEEARAHLRLTDRELNQLLLTQWQAPSGRQFFAKAFLQPY